MATSNYKRLHTFSKCPNRSQIALYFVIILTNLCFYLCVMRLVNEKVERQIIISIFTILSALMIFSGITTGQIDPSDQVTTTYLKNKKNFNEYLLENQKRINITEIRECIVCDAKCKKQSLHCKDCRICIEGRDHHCDYLNICIGRRNYKMFFITVCLTWCFLTMYIVSISIVTYEITKSNEHQQHFKSAEFIIGWIAACAVFITWVPITILLIFHCYLIKKNITTIQFLRRGKQYNHQSKQRQQTKHQSNSLQQKQKQIQQQNFKFNQQFQQLENHNQQLTNTIIIHQNNQNKVPETPQITVKITVKSFEDSIKFNQSPNNQYKTNTYFQSSTETKFAQKTVQNQDILQRKIQKKIKKDKNILKNQSFRQIIIKSTNTTQENKNIQHQVIQEVNLQSRNIESRQSANSTHLNKKKKISRLNSQTQCSVQNQFSKK